MIKSLWPRCVISLCLSLCACGITPPIEHQPVKPDIEQQRLPIAPDLPVVAKQPNEIQEKPLEILPTMVVPQAIVIDNRSIFFPPGRANIADDEQEKPKQCVHQLKQNPKQHILLISYSDYRGSKSYNLAMAEQRITAVTSALRSLGVERGQIRRNRSNSVKAAGPCQTEECRKKARRVEFICGT